MSTYQDQFSLWVIQREKRIELDDVLSDSRDVEHFAYFKRRTHADAAAQDFAADGYSVALGRRGLKTVLQATRTESLSDESVAQFLHGAISIVERHAGDYDGWGATVAQRPAE